MPGALTGIRIADMTGVGMGPMATQLLADMGAEVIKIEPPEGDVFRHVTPQRHAGMSHAYLNLNRNKRSVVLDVKTQQGREDLQSLIATCDVFVSNMRGPALKRLGLDSAQLRKDFPRLIHCACYGYSEQGPYAGRPAIDDTIQAACGLAWIQGDGGKSDPRYVNSVVADKVVALYVSNAITAALLARANTGVGQAVEVPMFECMVSFMSVEHLAGRTFDPPEGPAGYGRLLNEFRRPVRTQDGFLSVVPYTDGQWRRFFALTGKPEMGEDPRYRKQEERSRHFPALYQYVEASLLARSTKDWVEALAQADIPFSPVNSMDDLLVDPHLEAIGFWRRFEHPTEGKLVQAGIPIFFSETPLEVSRHAPTIGENTQEIIEEIRTPPRSQPF